MSSKNNLHGHEVDDDDFVPPSAPAVVLPAADSFLLDSLFGRVNGRNNDTEDGVGGKKKDILGEEEDEEEDAALIDSFFLPGGLLADDDEQNGGTTRLESLTATSNVVPSNPWENPTSSSFIQPSSSSDDGANHYDNSDDEDHHKDDDAMMDSEFDSNLCGGGGGGEAFLSLPSSQFGSSHHAPPEFRLAPSQALYRPTKESAGLSAINNPLPPAFDLHRRRHDKTLNIVSDTSAFTSPPMTTSCSSAVQGRYDKDMATTKIATTSVINPNRPDEGVRSSSSSGYNHLDHHERHSSSSTMGEELMMTIQSSPTLGNGDGYTMTVGTPKGSGRLIIDQPSPPRKSSDRRIVGRCSNRNNNNVGNDNNKSTRVSPNNKGRPAKTSSPTHRRHSQSLNSDENGWRDRSRVHHYHQPQQHRQHPSITYKTYNGGGSNHSSSDGVLDVGVYQEKIQISRGRNYSPKKNERRRNNKSNLRSSTLNNITAPKNIYESLDVYEQDDDNIDDDDNVADLHDEDDQGHDNEMVEENRLVEHMEDDEDNEGINENKNLNGQEGVEDADETSIPLHVCVNSLSGSSASSLSTSSDVDSEDESSRSTEGEEKRELPVEGIGYDTDQAHVSHIIGVGDGSTLVPKDIASTSSSVPYAVCPAEETPFSHASLNANGALDDQELDPNEKCRDGELQKTLISILRFPPLLCQQTYDFLYCRLCGSSFYRYLLQVTDDVKGLLNMAKNALHGLSIWVSEAKEAVAALAAQFLAAIGTILAVLAKVLILTASFLFQVWKYSLIEAAEESSVTICYFLFYFMPDLCFLVMDFFNLPHWSPHMITWVCVFLLCHQVKSGPLHQESDLSIFRTLTSSTPGVSGITSTAELDNVSTSAGGLPSSAASTEMSSNASERQQQQASQIVPRPSHIPRSNTAISAVMDSRRSHKSTLPKDERTCAMILKILRFVLPGCFLADGFSSEFGSMMGLSGASRLTTAFMMSLVRKNIVSSPIGWVSWAVQVLLTTYHSSWAFLDFAVLVVGLSSIRLIRHLDWQREKKKRR